MPLDPALRRRVVDVTMTSVTSNAVAPRPGGQVEAALGLMFQPGDRVIDRVTGLEGVVHAGFIVDQLVPVARPSID